MLEKRGPIVLSNAINEIFVHELVSESSYWFCLSWNFIFPVDTRGLHINLNYVIRSWKQLRIGVPSGKPPPK